MKKIVVLIILASITFSCGTPKTVIQSKKVIKGSWILDNTSYSQPGTYDVTLFNDVSKECFINSTWNFIPNNNTGMYSITDPHCLSTGDRKFIFTIEEMDANAGRYDLLLKPTDAKENSVDNAGFRLQLTLLVDTKMRWEQTMLVNGKPFVIYMNFTKTDQ